MTSAVSELEPCTVLLGNVNASEQQLDAPVSSLGKPTLYPSTGLTPVPIRRQRHQLVCADGAPPQTRIYGEYPKEQPRAFPRSPQDHASIMPKLLDGLVQQALGSCRCHQCVSGHANGVARRFGGTAVRSGRPKYWTSSTIWYSGIFAVAATFDAKQKQQRRERWDDAIAHLKQELEIGEARENAAAGVPEAEDPVAEEGVPGEKMPSGCGHGLLGGALAQVVDSKRWPVNTAGPVRRRQLTPESVKASAERCDVAATFDVKNKQQRIKRPDDAIADLKKALETGEARETTAIGVPLGEEAIAEDASSEETPLESECVPLGVDAVAEDVPSKETPLEFEYVPLREGAIAADVSSKNLPSESGCVPLGEDVVAQDAASEKRPSDLGHGLLGGALAQVVDSERWPVNTAGQVRRNLLTPESVYANEERRELHERRLWTPKKVEIVKTVANQMQVQLMLFATTRGYSEEDALSLPDSLRQCLDVEHNRATYTMLKERISRALKADAFLEGYDSHPEAGIRRTYEEHRNPRELNGGLRRLFPLYQHDSGANRKAQYDRCAIRRAQSRLLFSVCSTLMASNSLPNLDTYNILIAGFSDCNMKAAARVAISSLYFCQLRPNETTLWLVFRFYTKTNDLKRFSTWVDLLLGRRGGLALARPDCEDVEEEPGDWRVRRKLRIRGAGDVTKVVQLQYPTPKVFAAMLEGFLHFTDFDGALSVCRSMGEKGWGLCMDALGPLLDKCAMQGEWEKGLGVWEIAKSLETRAARMVGSEEEELEKIPMQVFAAMLDLCQGVGQHERLEEVWKHAKMVWRQEAVRIVKLTHRRIWPGKEQAPDQVPVREPQDSGRIVQARAPGSPSGDNSETRDTSQLFAERAASGAAEEARLLEDDATRAEPEEHEPAIADSTRESRPLPERIPKQAVVDRHMQDPNAFQLEAGLGQRRDATEASASCPLDGDSARTAVEENTQGVVWELEGMTRVARFRVSGPADGESERMAIHGKTQEVAWKQEGTTRVARFDVAWTPAKEEGDGVSSLTDWRRRRWEDTPLLLNLKTVSSHRPPVVGQALGLTGEL